LPIRLITAEQAREWIQRHEMQLGVEEVRYRRTKIPALLFSIPEDAGRRVALSRLLYPRAAAEVLLWTTSWSVCAVYIPFCVCTRRVQGVSEEHDVSKASAT